MKSKISAILIAALLAATAASFMTASLLGHAYAPKASAKAETAYQRVLRTGILRCGFSPWPPYFSLDPNTLELSGLSKDLSDAVIRLLELKLEYVQIVLGQQVQDLDIGRIDAMCGDGPWVISTIKYLDYSKPYIYAGVYIYGRADENRFSSFDDLNSPAAAFVGIDGDLSTDLVQSFFSQAKISTLGSLSDPSQLLLNVTTKKADAVIVDPLTATLFAKNNPGKIKMLLTQPVAVYGAGFSVKKGETDLLNMLNEAVSAAINTGQADRTRKKYDPDGTLFLPIMPPYRSP